MKNSKLVFFSLIALSLSVHAEDITNAEVISLLKPDIGCSVETIQTNQNTYRFDAFL